MINALTPQTQSFLTALNAIERRAQTAQQQLSTGLRINTVSDDPSQISDLLSVQAAISQNNQINQNLAQVKTETDTAESVVSNAVTLVEQAQSLGTQGASDMDSADTRQKLAEQVGSVLQQLVGAANTTSGGRFLFSGDADQTQPYTIDLTQTNPVSAYAGSAATREVQMPDGATAALTQTAQQIFDGAGDNSVFGAVNNLRLALMNNDTAGINSAISQLGTADSYLNTELAFYGTAQNRVNNGISYAATNQTQLQTQLSSIEDADETQSILMLQQSQTQEQAALESEAQLPRQTLFNFLG
jgi:flagellar hook-associated protein 3 FlgL